MKSSLLGSGLALETNLDDISGEVIGYCTSKLLEAGTALDVYTTSIQMKKTGPAYCSAC